MIIPGTGGGADSYALIASGGTDSLNGVPDVSLTASGLMAEVNSGVTTLPADQTVQTPGGQVTISFSGLPTTPTKIIEGNISMDIGPSGSPFVSIIGFFYVEQFTDGSTG